MKEREIIFRIGKPDPCWAMDSDVYIQLPPPPRRINGTSPPPTIKRRLKGLLAKICLRTMSCAYFTRYILFKIISLIFNQCFIYYLNIFASCDRRGNQRKPKCPRSDFPYPTNYPTNYPL